MSPEISVLFDYGADGKIEYVRLEDLEVFAKNTDTCYGPSDFSDEPWNGGCSWS